MTKKHLLIGAAIAAAAVLTTVKAADFNPQPDPPAFSADGVMTGETARLAVVCTSLTAATTNGSCTVDLEFEDLAGQMLKTETLTIAAGRGAFLDFAVPAAERPVRLEIIPCIKVHGRGMAVAASVEVFDTSTGKTQFHAEGLSPATHLIAGQ